MPPNCECISLDGDAVRETLNSDLGFSPEDRDENVRRIGEIAGLVACSGQIANIAFGLTVKPRRERPSREKIAARVEELLRLMPSNCQAGYAA